MTTKHWCSKCTDYSVSPLRDKNRLDIRAPYFQTLRGRLFSKTLSNADAIITGRRRGCSGCYDMRSKSSRSLAIMLAKLGIY
jgi:hypothetical protein